MPSDEVGDHMAAPAKSPKKASTASAKKAPAAKPAPAKKASTAKKSPSAKPVQTRSVARPTRSVAVPTRGVAPAAKKAAPAKKAPATKKSTATKKATPAKKAPAAKKAQTRSVARPTRSVAVPTREVAPAAKKAAPAKKALAPKKAAPAKKSLVVREDESPWTAKELAAVTADLHADQDRLNEEITNAEVGLADLIRDSGDGAGDDQADAGSKTFEREHEMSLANNARDMLDQVQHALNRIEHGTYGICESCGNAIGKMRLQAFPRATLCMSCKQAEERY